MQIRDYSLPRGWFPHDSAGVSAFLSDFSLSAENTSRAAIAPHAGWYYCGRIAARSVSSLKPDAQTIVVLGGHLGGGMKPLFAMEDAVKTPLGSLVIDAQLRSLLLEEINGVEDCYRDNTVEVLLPMVHYFFPKAKLIWLRLPSDLSSFETGKIIYRCAEKLKRGVNVLASTDLTHYGSNYGFSPKGRGSEALRWMREVNDAAFIKAVESGDSAEVLRLAENDHSACSTGAVLGAMGFAHGCKARLLEYGTSADAGADADTGADAGTSSGADKNDKKIVPDSFVGYASFTFS